MRKQIREQCIIIEFEMRNSFSIRQLQEQKFVSKFRSLFGWKSNTSRCWKSAYISAILKQTSISVWCTRINFPNEVIPCNTRAPEIQNILTADQLWWKFKIILTLICFLPDCWLNSVLINRAIASICDSVADAVDLT